ncbi:MAG: glycosyltransferase family 2 protein [Loktanella sp.]|nr:glycosyltransferase family 2 protein [Loktanella sp.]
MTRPTATMITCLRNEGPFLIEWLAYHRAIGFDRFIIGANDCTDGSHEMLTRLDELGEVIYLPFETDPVGQGPQFVFADLLLKSRRIADGDWNMWIDLDEFLVVHRGDHTVQGLIADLTHVEGMRINWRFFGVEPNVAWPGRQLHPDLCRCAPEQFRLAGRADHSTFKSLNKHRDGMHFYHHGPIMSESNVAAKPLWLGGDGKVLRRRAWPRKRIKFKAGESAAIAGHPVFSWAQINHYATRHPDFAEMRRRRGLGSRFVPDDPDSPSYKDFADSYSDAYFATYNQYSHHDDRILRHVPATDAQMARLLADETVRHWHEHAMTHLPSKARPAPLS